MAEIKQNTDKKTTAKERIMEAALELFAENGYSATTTREIVKKAGSSLSMLNLCFGSKENLYKEVLQEVLGIYVYDTLPFFGKVVEERANDTLTEESIWNYIEELTDIHLRIIMKQENRYAIMLLNRELQDKERFEIDLEPALMYIYHYQLLFEDYAKVSYGRWWARVLSFQTITGMFNLLTYPKLLVPIEEINSYLMEGPLGKEEEAEYIKRNILLTIKATLDYYKQQN